MSKITGLVQWFCPLCKHSNFDFTGADKVMCEHCSEIWSWNEILEYLKDKVLR